MALCDDDDDDDDDDVVVWVWSAYPPDIGGLLCIGASTQKGKHMMVVALGSIQSTGSRHSGRASMAFRFSSLLSSTRASHETSPLNCTVVKKACHDTQKDAEERAKARVRYGRVNTTAPFSVPSPGAVFSFGLLLFVCRGSTWQEECKLNYIVCVSGGGRGREKRCI